MRRPFLSPCLRALICMFVSSERYVIITYSTHLIKEAYTSCCILFTLLRNFRMARPTGPDGARSAVLSVRLTPKLRFGLEMLSRLHRESLPDILSRAINDVLTSEHDGLWDYAPGESERPRMLMPLLWDERSSDRLANIAFNCPHLLTASENRLWTLVKTKTDLWNSKQEYSPENLNRDALAECWGKLQLELEMPHKAVSVVKKK